MQQLLWNSSRSSYTVHEETTHKPLGDNSHVVFVNGMYKDDKSDIGKLMHDFRCTSSVDMFYPLLAKQVKYFKETEGGRKIVCKTFEDLAEKRANERVLEEKKLQRKGCCQEEKQLLKKLQRI